jgi:CubicO group peptidase (beta-lactamase class C family)
MITVHGHTHSRFSRLKDRLAQSLTLKADHGAQISVIIDDELVANIWGGFASRDESRVFEEMSLTPVFSTGKAIMAILIARLVDKGLIGYDSKIADVIHGFGAKGKEQITLGQFISHQGGLPGLRPAQDPTIWYDPAAVVSHLCDQAPLWNILDGSGYHPITGGYILGQIHKNLSGQTMGEALREHFLDLTDQNLLCGLKSGEISRVADLLKPNSSPDLGLIDDVKTAAFLDKGSSAAGRGSEVWRSMEIPSANMHSTSLGLARMMSLIANNGKALGRSYLSPSIIEKATSSFVHGQDRVLPFVMSWGAGFLRNQGLNIYGPNPLSVGHSGWGGSFVMADPAAKLSMAYVMNRQSHHLIGDPRALGYIEAVYSNL